MAAKDDPILVRAREAFSNSGKTLDELGVAMGFETGVARRAAWQFLNKVKDPKLSTLRRFAAAMELPLYVLLEQERLQDIVAKKSKK